MGWIFSEITIGTKLHASLISRVLIKSKVFIWTCCRACPCLILRILWPSTKLNTFLWWSLSVGSYRTQGDALFWQRVSEVRSRALRDPFYILYASLIDIIPIASIRTDVDAFFESSRWSSIFVVEGLDLRTVFNTHGRLVICKIIIGARSPALSICVFISKLVILALGDTLPDMEVTEIFPVLRTSWNASLGFITGEGICAASAAIMDAGVKMIISVHKGFSGAIIEIYTPISYIVLNEPMRLAVLNALPQTIWAIHHCVPPIRTFSHTVACSGIDVLVRVGGAVDIASLSMEVSVPIWFTRSSAPFDSIIGPQC